MGAHVLPDTTSFQEFLSSESGVIPLLPFILDLFLSAMLGYLLGFVYQRCGRSISNRKRFASNFPLLALTTMLVICIVKSSLALSLGLVGALSIVRFRSAIKEPEELSYLFLCIAIGLGFGANQRAITLTAFAIITGISLIAYQFRGREKNSNLYITITSRGADRIQLRDIVEILSSRCAGVELTRADENEDMLETVFHIDLDNFQQLDEARSELLRRQPNLMISFLDSKGVA